MVSSVLMHGGHTVDLAGDGWEGLVCARMTAYYTFLKYARLRELEKQGGR